MAIEDVRSNILSQTSLIGISVLGHVACASSTGGDNVGLENGSLEVFRGRLGSIGIVGHVASAAATVGGDHIDCGRW